MFRQLAAHRYRSKPSWKRSLAKAISWRLFAMVDTFVISMLVTNSLKWAGSIVSIELLTKMSLYFFHERAWAQVPAGVSVTPISAQIYIHEMALDEPG